MTKISFIPRRTQAPYLFLASVVLLALLVAAHGFATAHASPQCQRATVTGVINTLPVAIELDVCRHNGAWKAQ